MSPEDLRELEKECKHRLLQALVHADRAGRFAPDSAVEDEIDLIRQRILELRERL
jgi:hypothetical protein